MPDAMQTPRRSATADRAILILGRMRDHAALEQVHGVLQGAFTSFPPCYAPTQFRFERATRAGRALHQHTVSRAIRATGPSPLRTRFQRPLWILTAIAVLVLLIAGSTSPTCFSHGPRRVSRDVAALLVGAGRGRLIQQVLIESALVAGTACVIGVMFAALAAPAVVGMLGSPDDPVLLDLRRLAARRGHQRDDLADHRLARACAGVARVECPSR